MDPMRYSDESQDQESPDQCTLSIGTVAAEHNSGNRYNDGRMCDCMPRTVEATELLRGRIMAAIGCELDQFQQSMNLLLPQVSETQESCSVNGSQELTLQDDDMDYDCEYKENGGYQAEIERVLNGMLRDASQLLLSKLKC